MGEVYRAEDLRLGEPVALKFLPEKLVEDGAALARFHREVRTARLITHRNVVRVHDLGEVDGQPFLSMEYVDGEDLASLLRRIGRLPADKALEIARQLCAGLAAAHERGILHRDLKPGNVLVDGQGRAKITDFGLAALASDLRGARARRHSGLHGARAARRRARLVRERHLLARPRALRDVHRAQPVRGQRFAPGARAAAPERPAADVDPRAGSRPAARGGGAALPAARARAAAAVGDRRRGGAAGRRSAGGGARRGRDAVARDGGARARRRHAVASGRGRVARSVRRRHGCGPDRDRLVVGGANRGPAAAPGPRPPGSLRAPAHRLRRRRSRLGLWLHRARLRGILEPPPPRPRGLARHRGRASGVHGVSGTASRRARSPPDSASPGE